MFKMLKPGMWLSSSSLLSKIFCNKGPRISLYLRGNRKQFSLSRAQQKKPQTVAMIVITLFGLNLIGSAWATNQAADNPTAITADSGNDNYSQWTTEDLLRNAEQYRSTDIELSKALLDILALRSLDNQQHAQYSYLRAYHLILIGEYQQSLTAFTQLSASKNVNTRLQALSYILNLHLLERNYQQAFSQLDSILTLLSHPDIEPKLYTKTLMGIGYFYNKLGAYRQALDYLGRLTNRPLTKRQQCLVFAHKLDALIGLDQTSPQDVLYHSTLNFCTSIGENIIVEGVIADMALLQIREANYSWVIETLESRLASVEQNNYPMNMAEFYAHLAVSYYRMENAQKAWFYGTKAMSYSESFKINSSLHQASKIMAELAKSQGTPEQAYIYLADKLERQQTHFIQQRAQEGVRQNLEFELEKNKQLFTDLSIHLAKQNSQIRIVNQEIDTLNKQNLISLGYIGLGIFVVLGLGLSVFGTRKSKEAILKKSQLDDLTQVYDRAHLLKHFSSKWKDIQSMDEQKACLFCLQLDQLSEINYRNGHNLADWLIEKTSQILRNNAPHSSLIGRYKGSMLVMLLPATDMHRLLQIQGRVIEQIERLNPSIFLTYKFPYHSTSMLVNLQGRKQNIYALLAHCQAKMAVKTQTKGHKLIIDDVTHQQDNEIATQQVPDQPVELNQS
ncbi:GGDEF domain-containing protein [Thalassotalea litorea]|nr:GGDEF domain-containing protein [Thalassotalea litorea]